MSIEGGEKFLMIRQQVILDEIYRKNNDDYRKKNYVEEDFDFDFEEEEEVVAAAEVEEEDYRHCRKQTHTHEYLGSVKIVGKHGCCHNHRLAGVTGQAIPTRKGSHYHKLEDKTDFYEDHFHIVEDRTGPAIYVGDRRHVHFVYGYTTVNDKHRHEFQFATLIDNPIGD